MINPQLEKLLIVQEKDLNLQKHLNEVSRIPLERSKIQNMINMEEEAIQFARRDLNDREIERKNIDAKVLSREAEVSKFKNQQLEVKKNDEYRALALQIEQAQSDIGVLEEEEISLMYTIDEAFKEYNLEKVRIESRISEQKLQMQLLESRLVELKALVEIAENDYANSRKEVELNFLEDYDRVRNQVKRTPYIVPIDGHICGGCHLRVSNDVLSQCNSEQVIVICDQCSRVVFRG